MANDPFDPVDPEFIAHTEEHAQEWAEWAKHDFAHFVQIIMDKTGASRQEVLLYLIGERLGQIIEQGISAKIVVRHEVPPPPREEGDEWKK